MAFSPVPPDGGVGAAHAALAYSRTDVEWRYDPISGVYYRWTDGVAHLDALTGKQLAFENVIVLSAYHEEVVLFPEKYFGEETSLYIELIGEGPVTLLRDGSAFGGRWVRAERGSTFSYVTPDGTPLHLKPGRTFIQIIRAGFEELELTP
jgi:hypothetical protein